MWRKSSYSGENATCVEVALGWQKSSYSGENAGCVEVALAGRAAVRDSKDVTGPMLSFGVPAWTSFLSAVKSGRFDLV